jgi:hypothetical protein
MSVTAPSVMLWFASHGDKRMDEIPRWEKDTFWIVPGRTNGQNDRGRGW